MALMSSWHGCWPNDCRLACGSEIVPAGFDGLYDALLASRCDAVLSALPYDPLRTEDVVYSVAYLMPGWCC